jgi:DNA (cytosine-5)-methyltransferase 1
MPPRRRRTASLLQELLPFESAPATTVSSVAATLGLTSTHLFCGGGGDLRGFAEAGVLPWFAANHAAAAIATILANWPGIGWDCCDINTLDFRRMPKTRILVGSPICTEATPAGRNSTAGQDRPNGKGGKGWALTRATAWDLLRAAEVHGYDVVVGENVFDFVTRWNLFEVWASAWDRLGYTMHLVSLNAAHIAGPGNLAAPQHRHRVLFVCVKKSLPQPDLTLRPDCICPNCGPVQGVQSWGQRFDRTGERRVGVYGKQYRYMCPNLRCQAAVEPVVRTIRDHIDLTEPGRLVRDGKPHFKKFTPYADETRRKIAVGLQRFGQEPFLVILRNHCTVQSLDEPIGAITAEGNHHMLVKPGPTVEDCEVKMISFRTKAAAQRFPQEHEFLGDTDADLTRQIGNAVPVNVGHWLASRIVVALAA